MRRLRGIAAGGALLAALPHLAVGATPECQRDLFFTESSLKSALAAFEKAEARPQAVQCPYWRQQLETMRKARAVYARCLTGPDREAQIATVSEQAALFEDRLRRCPRS